VLVFKVAKASFFDRPAVTSAVEKAAIKVLSRFGAFVRTRARTSIRKKKGTSPPGGPPYSHVGLLRKFIFFSYDKSTESVVIGPTLINSPTGAPENLEYGGTTERPAWYRGKDKTIRIRPRPYMGPAFDAELPNLEPMWRDSVR
jgi:hypothetical protein